MVYKMPFGYAIVDSSQIQKVTKVKEEHGFQTDTHPVQFPSHDLLAVLDLPFTPSFSPFRPEPGPVCRWQGCELGTASCYTWLPVQGVGISYR